MRQYTTFTLFLGGRVPSSTTHAPEKLRRNTATMSTATANGNDDDLRSRGQQSPLASQRAKQSSAPTEANRTGRFTGYFPLGYKEGFSQWVHTGFFGEAGKVLTSLVGKCTIRQSRTCCHVLHTISQTTAHSYPDRKDCTLGNPIHVFLLRK